MRKKVNFVLRGEEATLALAFQRQCHYELGMSESLDVLAQRIFLNFLAQHVDKSEPVNASGTPDDSGDMQSAAEQPTSTAPAALADSADGTDQATSGS